MNSSGDDDDNDYYNDDDDDVTQTETTIFDYLTCSIIDRALSHRKLTAQYCSAVFSDSNNSYATK